MPWSFNIDVVEAMISIDLTKVVGFWDSTSSSILTSKQCGCVCQRCGWRGLRVIHFKTNRRMDPALITGIIKGIVSYPNCTKCGRQVVFTHYPTPNRTPNRQSQ